MSLLSLVVSGKLLAPEQLQYDLKKISGVENRLNRKFDREFKKLHKLLAHGAVGRVEKVERDQDDESDAKSAQKADEDNSADEYGDDNDNDDEVREGNDEPFPEGSIGVIMSTKPQSWQSSLDAIEAQGGKMYTTTELAELL